MDLEFLVQDGRDLYLWLPYRQKTFCEEDTKDDVVAPESLGDAASFECGEVSGELWTS